MRKTKLGHKRMKRSMRTTIILMTMKIMKMRNIRMEAKTLRKVVAEEKLINIWMLMHILTCLANSKRELKEEVSNKRREVSILNSAHLCQVEEDSLIMRKESSHNSKRKKVRGEEIDSRTSNIVVWEVEVMFRILSRDLIIVEILGEGSKEVISNRRLIKLVCSSKRLDSWFHP